MKKTSRIEWLFVAIIWLIPTIIIIGVLVEICFPNPKYYQIDQDEYIHLKNYQWSYELPNKPRYLGKHTEINKDGEEESYSVVALQGLWSKKYIGTSKIAFLNGPAQGDVYMLKDAKEPIMFMDIQENQQAVTINTQEFSIEEIVDAIRNIEPEKYDEENFENCLEESLYIYLSPTKNNHIRFSCRLLYDSEADEYYIVRYDIKDSCYYMHNVP